MKKFYYVCLLFIFLNSFFEFSIASILKINSIETKPVTKITYADYLSEINPKRYISNVEQLSAFKSRYTFSKGCNAARDFLKDYFINLGLNVSLQNFQIENEKEPATNVVAVLPGTQDKNAKGDFFLLGAHYDSIAKDTDPAINAPGAEDNASGVAGLMELASLFKDHPLPTTIVFVAFSGEEQGLLGSKAYVAALKSSENIKHLRAAFIMDMIGYMAEKELRVTLETHSKCESMLELPISLAKEYTKLKVIKSLKPFGSDHMPFLNNELPSVLIIENDWDKYPGYHKSSDRPEFVSKDLSQEILKLIAMWVYEATKQNSIKYCWN